MRHVLLILFFFNDTATAELYTLSLHAALPILVRLARSSAPPIACRALSASRRWRSSVTVRTICRAVSRDSSGRTSFSSRSEEHTSELQSRQYLVCRLLLEKITIFYLSLQI